MSCFSNSTLLHGGCNSFPPSPPFSAFLQPHLFDCLTSAEEVITVSSRRGEGGVLTVNSLFYSHHSVIELRRSPSLLLLGTILSAFPGVVLAITLLRRVLLLSPLGENLSFHENVSKGNFRLSLSLPLSPSINQELPLIPKRLLFSPVLRKFDVSTRWSNGPYLHRQGRDGHLKHIEDLTPRTFVFQPTDHPRAGIGTTVRRIS